MKTLKTLFKLVSWGEVVHLWERHCHQLCDSHLAWCDLPSKMMLKHKMPSEWSTTAAYQITRSAAKLVLLVAQGHCLPCSRSLGEHRNISKFQNTKCGNTSTFQHYFKLWEQHDLKIDSNIQNSNITKNKLLAFPIGWVGGADFRTAEYQTCE